MIGFFKKLLLLSCVSCLQIFEINPLLIALFPSVLSHPVCCLFVLLMVSFAVQKLLSLIMSRLFVFISITVGDRQQQKNIAAIYVRECSAYGFLQELCSIWSYLWSLIHVEFVCLFVCFCIWYQRMFYFHSFTYSCLVFSALLIEQTVFSPLYILASLFVDQLTISLWVYFWDFSPFPLIYVCLFESVPYCRLYSNFVLGLKSGSMIPPTLFLFLKIVLAIQGLLCFHTNLIF